MKLLALATGALLVLISVVVDAPTVAGDAVTEAEMAEAATPEMEEKAEEKAASSSHDDDEQAIENMLKGGDGRSRRLLSRAKYSRVPGHSAEARRLRECKYTGCNYQHGYPYGCEGGWKASGPWKADGCVGAWGKGAGSSKKQCCREAAAAVAAALHGKGGDAGGAIWGALFMCWLLGLVISLQMHKKGKCGDTGTSLFCKLFFPECAVILHQGCENPGDHCGAFWLGCWFTVFCWTPAGTERGRRARASSWSTAAAAAEGAARRP